MNSMTGSILIDFQNMPGSQQEKDYHNQVYGAVKLHLTEMEKYEKTSHFNICKKCGMVLTREDKLSVYDWEELNSNPKEFKEIIEKHKEDGENIVLWICSFCESRNVIQCQNLKFAKNNSRVIERPQTKNFQNKDPIMLIVFDISGSMDEVLEYKQQNQLYSSFMERIKTTKIYKKIVEDEQQEIKEIIEKQKIKIDPNESRYKYKDFLKKNKLLMGLTEWLINQINPNNSNQKMNRRSGFSGVKDKKKPATKSIGFMFFNSNVILEPTNGDKSKRIIAVCDQKQMFGFKIDNMIDEKVNFDDFQSLYKLGAKYGEEYNTKINEFKFDNLQYKFGDSSRGQTALGPALVIALGVISTHGAGSSIVVVTDGIGNKGIFDQSQKWQQPLKQMKLKLQKHKCFLAMFQCRNIGENPNQKDINNIRTCIDQFCVTNDDTIAKKINIIVDKNKGAEQAIEDIRKKMASCINRQHIIWTNQVKIKCQNVNVSYEDDISKLSQKLINHLQPVYMKPKIDFNKLKEKDYLHHFMTQAVIKYEDTKTGQQSLFMTYMLQKFIKFNNIRKSTIKKLDNEKTFHDMMEYLSIEEENYDISNVPLSFVKKTFRDTLMFSKSIYNRSLRFPMKGHMEAKQEDVVFFEDIFKKNEPIKQEEGQYDPEHQVL